MAKNRVVLSFSAASGGDFGSLAGWTETLFRDVDEAPDTLLTALVGTATTAPTIPYIGERRVLLTSGWRIDRVTVYPITGIRQAPSRVFPGNSMGGLDLPGTPNVNDVEQQPYDRLLWRMNAAGGHSRSCRLGGIMSTVVDPGGNYSAPLRDPGWANYFDLTFIQHLITAQFGLRFSTVSDPHSITGVVTDPLTVTGASPRTPVIQVAGNQTAVFPANGVVRISGQESPARLNGQWTVGAVAAVGALTNVTLRSKRSLTVTGDFHGGGYMRSITYSVAAMTSGSAVRGVSRRVGRPSGLPRGRRSRRTS